MQMLVAYQLGHIFGNAEITRPVPLVSFDDLMEVRRAIAEDYSARTSAEARPEHVILLNIMPLPIGT